VADKKRPAARALQLIVGQPWAMTREALETVIAIAQRENHSPEAVAAELGRPLVNTRTVTVRDGVARIPFCGPLFRYANLFTEVSGATSYEMVATDFTRAVNDPAIGAIVLAIDSPGGEVNGVSELAALVYGARGKKPIMAHVSGFGASGAYWIAAAADEVITSDTGVLGSIGVEMTVVEEDEQQDGYQQLTFRSSQSPQKNADTRTPAGAEQVQALVDELGAVFVSAVARYRGVSEEKVLADFGQGGLLVGKAAVKVGMADRVMTAEQVHAMLVDRLGGRSSRSTVRARAAVDVPESRVLSIELAGGLSELAAACLKTGILSRSHLGGGLTPVSSVAPATPGLADSRPHSAGIKEEAMADKDKDTPDPVVHGGSGENGAGAFPGDHGDRQ
jgi:signal peptide peptidase SppA